MTEATKKATSVTEAMPTDALKDAGQKLLTLLVQRAAQSATERVTGLTDRLDDVTTNGGSGIGSVFGGGREDDSDDQGDEGSGLGATLKSGVSSLKDKIKNAFGGGKGGTGKKLKVTNIVESIDVGLPLRTTYDLWTQFADFPSFMKKVESVEQSSDEKTNWKAQVFLSHRTWEATIAEQVPDSHIVWRSKGAKGHVDGAVSFTELGPNLTHVLLVLEYWPQGLFERTGNIWRAQGRRARLEFKHFRRYAMTNVLLHQEEVTGWRGEIRDSQVVRTHEEALEDEEQAPSDDVQTDEPVADQDTDTDTDTDTDEPYDDEDEWDDDYDEADDADDEADYEYDDEEIDDPVDERPSDHDDEREPAAAASRGRR
ncbi:SRPBCC family protein [Pseudonocardia spinosispora]|uniref:SRPBCC family protein n=1 Tax=Pseudonocardia spinosispora TaxID=103441 RepID=UPI0003FBA89D|nr:SRPBCC family protein [Pseudonocardia spinosispora]